MLISWCTFSHFWLIIVFILLLHVDCHIHQLSKLHRVSCADVRCWLVWSGEDKEEYTVCVCNCVHSIKYVKSFWWTAKKKCSEFSSHINTCTILLHTILWCLSPMWCGLGMCNSSTQWIHAWKPTSTNKPDVSQTLFWAEGSASLFPIVMVYSVVILPLWWRARCHVLPFMFDEIQVQADEVRPQCRPNIRKWNSKY